MFFPPRVKRKNRLSTPVRAAGVFPARSLGKKPFPLSLLRVLKSRCRYLFYRGRCLGYFSSFRSKRGRVDKRREEKMGATTLVELEDPPPFSSFLPFRSLFPCSADRQRSTLASGGVNAVTCSTEKSRKKKRDKIRVLCEFSSSEIQDPRPRRKENKTNPNSPYDGS